MRDGQLGGRGGSAKGGAFQTKICGIQGTSIPGWRQLGSSAACLALLSSPRAEHDGTPKLAGHKGSQREADKQASRKVAR